MALPRSSLGPRGRRRRKDYAAWGLGIEWVQDAVPTGEGLLKESSRGELMFNEIFLLAGCFVSVLSAHHPKAARELCYHLFTKDKIEN